MEKILLAKKVVYDYNKAFEFLDKGKKVIDISYNSDTWALIGYELTYKNFDERLSYYLKYNSNCAPVLYCDVLIFDNKSKIDIPKGDYEIGIVSELNEEK